MGDCFRFTGSRYHLLGQVLEFFVFGEKEKGRMEERRRSAVQHCILALDTSCPLVS